MPSATLWRSGCCGTALSAERCRWYTWTVACRNCVDTCNCALVSTGGSISITGTGTSLNPYDLSVGVALPLPYTVQGLLSTQTGVVRMYFSQPATITNVIAGVGTAPVGDAIIVDVNKNGTSMFTSGNRPTIAAGTNSSIENPPDVSANASVDIGDYITVDIDQVGSSVAGNNLVVTVEYVR